MTSDITHLTFISISKFILKNMIKCFFLTASDQNYLWTSGDALCSTDFGVSNTNCVGVKWCASGLFTNKTKTIHLPRDMRRLCLAFNRAVQSFQYRPCRSRYNYICKVWKLHLLKCWYKNCVCRRLAEVHFVQMKTNA